MKGKENLSNPEESPNQEKLKVDCFVSTIACERHPDRNEDDSFFDANKGIFGVFDGMGGMSDGQWCAQTSRQIIQENLSNNHHLLPRDVSEVLINASKKANEKVFYHYEGIGGSTATFGLLCEASDGVNQIFLSHTGDSRAYLFRDDKLIILTIDDNNSKYSSKDVQNELDNVTNESDLSQQAFKLFQTRNLISNFVGMGRDVSPKIIIKTILPDDLLVLTTDGVHDNLTTTEIHQIISQNSKKQDLISKKLTEAALLRSREGVLRSKPDDMTALVAVFSKDESASQPQPETIIPSTEFIPKVGEEITLQRTSGHIEAGWKIISQIGNKIVVNKLGPDGVLLQKTVPIGDVERFNRPPKEEDIPTSQNIQQLKFTIAKLGGLQGSNYFFPADYLLSRIDNAFANNGSEESLRGITRTGNLRNTVERLIKSQKENR